LTQCFLNVKVPKILLLAGSDRMDKELTIAQMQGKFKLCVLNNVGHLIHEDNPSATFEIIENFINTFRIPSKMQDLKPIVGKLGSANPKIIKYEENN
jgi:protein phosphatase methylesterase 1